MYNARSEGENNGAHVLFSHNFVYYFLLLKHHINTSND